MWMVIYECGGMAVYNEHDVDAASTFTAQVMDAGSGLWGVPTNGREPSRVSCFREMVYQANKVVDLVVDDDREMADMVRNKDCWMKPMLEPGHEPEPELKPEVPETGQGPVTKPEPGPELVSKPEPRLERAGPKLESEPEAQELVTGSEPELESEPGSGSEPKSAPVTERGHAPEPKPEPESDPESALAPGSPEWVLGSMVCVDARKCMVVKKYKRKRMTVRFEDGVFKRKVEYDQVSRLPGWSLGSQVYVGTEKGRVIKDTRPKFGRATTRFESGEKRRKADSVLISLVEQAEPAVGHMEDGEATQGEQQTVLTLGHFSRHFVPGEDDQNMCGVQGEGQLLESGAGADSWARPGSRTAWDEGHPYGYEVNDLHHGLGSEAYAQQAEGSLEMVSECEPDLECEPVVESGNLEVLAGVVVGQGECNRGCTCKPNATGYNVEFGFLGDE